MKTILAFIFAAMVALPATAQGYKVGDMARGFTLKNIDGKMVSLSDFSSKKGVIVIFSCNHCPYVKAYEDRMEALNKKLAPKGYPIVAINPNDPARSPEDSYEHMQQRAREKGFTFPYLVDGTQEIAKTYGATRTPHVYLLKNTGDGKWKVAYIGAIDDSPNDPETVSITYLEDAITAVDAGKAADPDFTRAIGCTIKWKQ